MNPTKITIVDIDGDRTERVSLPKPFFEAPAARRPQDSTGVWITGLYYGPRSGRCFIATYSIWDRGDGVVEGAGVKEVEILELGRVADQMGAELPPRALAAYEEAEREDLEIMNQLRAESARDLEEDFNRELERLDRAGELGK